MSEKIDIVISAKDLASATLRGVQSTVSSMARVATTAIAAVGAGFVAAGTAGVKSAMEFEQTATALRVMTGDVAKANALLSDLSKFAAETPFEFPEIADAGKRLLAFGFATETIQDNLRRLGDVASSLNIPLGELSDIYGKARVQGRLQMEDINQLTGRGIPIISELAKTMGVAEGQIRKMVEQGKVGFPEVQKAFENMTNEGGRFTGGMLAQSTTFGGLMSTAKDAIMQQLREIVGISSTGEIAEGSIFAKLKESMAEFIEFLETHKEDIKAAMGIIQSAFEVAFSAIGAVLSVFTGTSGGQMQGYFIMIQEMTREFLDTVRKFWEEHGENIKTVIKFAFDLIVAVITVAMKTLLPIVKTVLKAIGQAFDFLAALIRGDFSGAWVALKGLIGTVVNAIWAVVKAVFGAIANFLSVIWGGIKSASGALWEWMKGNWTAGMEIIKNKVADIGTAIAMKFTDIVTKAKEWGANMITAVIDGIKQKIEDMKAGLVEIATTIEDYLGFHSPTRKGPGSQAHKWMPNLIDMLAHGLSENEGKIEAASKAIALSLGKSLTPEQNNQFAEKIKQIAGQAQSAFSELQSKIDAQKGKVGSLKEDYSALQLKLKQLGEDGAKDLKKISDQLDDNARKIAGIKTTGQGDVAKRAIELENQLADARKEPQGTSTEEEAKRQAKIASLETELALAQQFAGTWAIDAQRIENAKSETQLIIDRVAQKTIEAEAERAEIQKNYEEKRLTIEKEKADVQAQIEAKKIAIKSEQDAYKELLRQRRVLDQAYFDAFNISLRQQVNEIQNAINLTRQLASMSRSGGGGIAGARASGGPVEMDKTYLVGEKGPELFVPSRSGTIVPNSQLGGGGAPQITINLGGVQIQKAEDIQTLANKVSETLTRKLELFKLGIS